MCYVMYVCVPFLSLLFARSSSRILSYENTAVEDRRMGLRLYVNATNFNDCFLGVQEVLCKVKIFQLLPLQRLICVC